ncbi:MAG: N,N-dimethylformamidase beta subunit family domain-containing protein [Aeoliella sp.]
MHTHSDPNAGPSKFTRRRVMQAGAVTLLTGAALGRITWGDEDDQTDKPFLHGYAGTRSCVAVDKMTFHTSTNIDRYDVEIARIGIEPKVVWTKKNLPGAAYELPPHATSHGCDWPVAFEITIPKDWPTGCYEAWTTARVGDQKFKGNRIFFVVRSSHPGRDAKILLQLSTNTQNAYNGWGGFSLYTYWGVWDVTHEESDVLGRRVTFQRPFDGINRQWDLPFIRWAELAGYKIDYAINSDLEFHPEILPHYKLVLSVGHDEYWSAPMRDNLEKFIAQGGNVAFFSGNVCCWQVRSEEGGNDLVCWKEAFLQDPLYNEDGPNPLLTTLWSHHLVKRPENELTGVGVLRGGFHNSGGHFMGDGGYTVHQPDHWVFEGTGLTEGEKFGEQYSVVGYEVDGCEFVVKDGKPVPTGRDGTPKDFKILATAPARWGEKDVGWYKEWYDRWKQREHDHGCMGIYTNPGGGTVFTAATTDWSHGLGRRQAASGPLGPGHAVGVFRGGKWNVLDDHYSGKVIDENGSQLPHDVTIEFGAAACEEPITNWGQVTQMPYVNESAPPGVGRNALMSDMLYSKDSETIRQQGGVRIKGLPAGRYDVFAMLRHFAGALSDRYEWAIGVNIDRVPGNSFISPGGASKTEWVRAGRDTPGNYAREQVEIVGPDDFIVMIYDDLDKSYIDVMGFQIARVAGASEDGGADQPFKIQFDVGGGSGDKIVERITRNVLDRLSG